ncbi:chitin synthase 1 [Sarcoptes scabiei]|nr:chitin synthase 1 [Sarcoptes scabiei]
MATFLHPIREESLRLGNGSIKNSPSFLALQNSLIKGLAPNPSNSKGVEFGRKFSNFYINTVYDDYSETIVSDVPRKVSFKQSKSHSSGLKSEIDFNSNSEPKEENSDPIKEKPPEWDRFITLPPPDEDETQKSEWVEEAIKWLKVMAYVFTFLMILSLTVLSKTILLLMTSMVSSDHSVSICNNDNHIDPPLDHDKRYFAIYQADTPSRIAWLWSLYFAAIAPYVFALGRSLRIIYFKTWCKPKFSTFIIVFVAESLHCIGLSILLFVILPKIDVIKGAMMMNSVCFVPILIRLMVGGKSIVSPSSYVSAPISSSSVDILKRNSFQSANESFDEITMTDLDAIEFRKFDHLKLARNLLLHWINFLLQSVILVIWTYIGHQDRLEYFYLIPIALVLVSFEWWENYVVPDSMRSFVSWLSDCKYDLIRSRYFVFAIISLWKIIFIFILMATNEFVNHGDKVFRMLFLNFTDSFNYSSIPVIRDKRNHDHHVLFDSDHNELDVDVPLWPVWMLLIHITVTYLAYSFAKFSCKVCFQTISFAIPLCLAVPMTISILWAISGIGAQDKCQLVEIFEPFQFIFWKQSTLVMFDMNLKNLIVWIVSMLSFINQVTNSLHIWKETSERLASTEQMFVSPLYNSILIDQSLVFNRRCLKLAFTPNDDEEHDHETKDIEGGLTLKTNERIDSKLMEETIENLDENNNRFPSKSFESFHSYNNHIDDVMAEKLNRDQTILDDWSKDWHRICEEMGVEEDSIDAKSDPADDETIRIYVCATMWHEDRNEMFQMLKAVMRLDYEQGIRRIAKKEFGDDVRKVIYEMEVNIYFDDAFEQGKSDDEDDRVVNRFVEQLIHTIGDSANQVFGQNLEFQLPTIVPTPYGGKLIWKLPMGTNRLVAHIKDKNLIRHRKRWSQCMYMYYLLGFRLAARKDLDIHRKKTIMNNTFILALDGDINFRPQAVDLVVDLMKKNDNLGAACGRIHPIGSGPIVWYQKFEYAMGHWLQKATEHVIGCVLCSPGCFSLFRARALMDKSVMNKYTTKPSAAQHYVQYDQGEDRWLCTLLLQRGWRIEYCAASDSYTHAPEGFAEFYTQRRRWGPSTMANILDLLGDYKQTVKMNDNISYLYIIYQGFLMLGTIISPGTIFLMVVSAMNTVMGISSQMSFIYNMVPLVAFILICLHFEDNNIKITIATILSVFYALLMLAVLVGTGIDMYMQGFFSPNSLFFSAMMASFLMAAILHPQEFTCVLPLPIYMLFIPSMYMLLTIYSITNMNVVSWGTREVKSKLSAKELARQKEEEEERIRAANAKKKSKFLNFSNVGSNMNSLFTCMCCSGLEKDQDVNDMVQEIKIGIKQINDVINNSDRKKEDWNQQTNLSIDSMEEDKINQNSDLRSEMSIRRVPSNLSTKIDSETRQRGSSETNEIRKPRWILNNELLNRCPIKSISAREEEFWTKMIAKYLYPLDEDLKEKERISNELAELRNKFVFIFAFLNVIFILFVFMLQIHKDVFGIDIPVGFNGTSEIYDPEEDRKIFVKNVITTRMDPINLTLVVFFGAILIIQCIGMFIHRFGTLAHLLAYTELRERKKKFDYSSFIAKLIENKTRLHKNVRRKKNKDRPSSFVDVENSGSIALNFDDSPDDDEHDSFKSSESDIKPSQYGDVIGKVIQELKSDHSQIDRMSKVMRKNTMHAIKRHEFRQQQQQQQQQQSTQQARVRKNSQLSINIDPNDQSNRKTLPNYSIHLQTNPTSQSISSRASPLSTFNLNQRYSNVIAEEISNL